LFSHFSLFKYVGINVLALRNKRVTSIKQVIYYLSNKTSVPVFYRVNKIWVLVRLRMK